VNVFGSVIASNLSKLRGEYDSAITNLISVDEQFVLTNGQVRLNFQIHLRSESSNKESHRKINLPLPMCTTSGACLTARLTYSPFSPPLCAI
jgi:hypothetical protein